MAQMNRVQIQNRLNQLQSLATAKPVVEFGKDAGDMEAYPETGMRARFLGVSWDGHGDDETEAVFKVQLSFEGFEDHNRPFEQANYYDNNHVPRLTAREAGQYKMVDFFYVSPDVMTEDPTFDYFHLTDSSGLLMSEFSNSGEANYVKWLEQQVLKLRRSE